MRTILSRALAELNAHRSVVLVTIVAEQGSAPRGPGSQMLVGADGQLTGTIGGGQVERQSELLALSLLKERRSQIQHFALTQAGADSLGMACGGDVTVLFQFISPEDALWRSVLETALAQLTAAQPGWLILRTDGSAPALLDGEGISRTENRKIFIAKPEQISVDRLEAMLDTLRQCIEEGGDMRACLHELVPTFREPQQVNQNHAEAAESVSA